MEPNELKAKFEALEAKLELKMNQKLEEKFRNLELNLFDKVEKRLSSDPLSSTDRTRVDSIPVIDSSLRENNENVIEMKVKLENISKQFAASCFKYDKIFMDNMIIPGLIGDYCKYKNLKEYLDHHDREMMALSNFKDRQTHELQTALSKQEQMGLATSNRLKQTERTALDFANRSTATLKKLFEEKVETLHQEISQCRTDNCSAVLKFTDRYSALEADYEKMKSLKEIFQKDIELGVQDMKLLHKQTKNDFADMETEFKAMKTKFEELSEFIRDIRFRRNISNFAGEEVKKREVKELSINISYNKIQKRRKKKRENSVDILRERVRKTEEKTENRSAEKDKIRTFIGKGGDLDVSDFDESSPIRTTEKKSESKSNVTRLKKRVESKVRKESKVESRELSKTKEISKPRDTFIREVRVQPMVEIKQQIAQLGNSFMKVKQDLFRIVKQHRENNRKSNDETREMINQVVLEIRQFLPITGEEPKKTKEEDSTVLRPIKSAYSRQNTEKEFVRTETRKLTGTFLNSMKRNETEFGQLAMKNLHLKELKIRNQTKFGFN